MSKRNIAILIAATALGVQVNLAAAAESAIPPQINEGGELLPAVIKYLEQRGAIIRSEARAAPAAVKVTGSAGYINVAHLETVKIENAKGQSFVWTADSVGDFPLQAIAPKDFQAGLSRVFVSHPYGHLLTD